MSRATVRMSAAAAFLVIAAAVLLLLTQRAQSAGRLTYCRNNLRQLGILACARYAANYEQIPEARGRAFWQALREGDFRDPRTKQWRVASALNPYGCPVRGVAPLDLGALDPAALAAHLSDPKTIDYRGPSGFPEAPSKMVLGADLEGNHPGGGGHVLFADFTILSKDAVGIGTEWEKASATRD